MNAVNTNQAKGLAVAKGLYAKPLHSDPPLVPKSVEHRPRLGNMDLSDIQWVLKYDFGLLVCVENLKYSEIIIPAIEHVRVEKGGIGTIKCAHTGQITPPDAQLVSGVIVHEVNRGTVVGIKQTSYCLAAVRANPSSSEGVGTVHVHVATGKRQEKTLFIEQLPSKSPIGLLHFRWSCVPIDFESHQQVLIHVYVPQP